jgi:hypothetical protein
MELSRAKLAGVTLQNHRPFGAAAIPDIIIEFMG